MIRYLSTFVPSISSHTEALRRLSTSKADFHWTTEHENEFQKLKELLSKAPVLHYYYPSLPVTIQTDSSQTGIGSCLLQNGRPIAYASRALSKFEQRYAQIEKELLAVFYAVEQFHYYLYGQPVTVETDHKLLEQILTRSFDRISPRLQQLCLRLLRYNVLPKYTLGLKCSWQTRYLEPIFLMKYTQKKKMNFVYTLIQK